MLKDVTFMQAFKVGFAAGLGVVCATALVSFAIGLFTIMMQFPLAR